MKKALLFGATGFIGSLLLDRLLVDPEYSEVITVTRKPLSISHPRLKQLKGDLSSLPSIKDQLKADHIFIAIGTTKAKTPDEREYYAIDHDLPVLAAQLARDNGADAVMMVSAVGANSKSGVFYIRTKGDVERDVIALDYPRTYLFRPSMILGNREEKRPLEKFLIRLFRIINPLFVGAIKKYRGIEGSEIAESMILAAKRNSEKLKFFEWQEMKKELND